MDELGSRVFFHKSHPKLANGFRRFKYMKQHNRRRCTLNGHNVTAVPGMRASVLRTDWSSREIHVSCIRES